MSFQDWDLKMTRLWSHIVTVIWVWNIFETATKYLEQGHLNAFHEKIRLPFNPLHFNLNSLIYQPTGQWYLNRTILVNAQLKFMIQNLY